MSHEFYHRVAVWRASGFVERVPRSHRHHCDGHFIQAEWLANNRVA